jgi:predicted ATPase
MTKVRRQRARPGDADSNNSETEVFLRYIELHRDQIANFDLYPFAIPAVRHLERLNIHPRVTFFVGENGSGKSTLLEAIAVAAGFNAEGGSRNFRFATRRSESDLHQHLRLVRGTRRPKTGYFLRAESFFNVATEVEKLDAEPSFAPRVITSYGGRSLHAQSHGESFIALVTERFGPGGLYLLDEPEAALSPQRQLALLKLLHELVQQRCQFIISTHSPMLLAYPDACIYHLSDSGVEEVDYEDTEHYALTRDFLMNRERYFRAIFS